MDARIKRDCPFCGEREHVEVSESSCPFATVVDGDTLKDENGFDVEDYVDGACCRVCNALVPLHVWNSEVPQEVFAVLRDFDPPGPPAGSCHDT
ncbi:hypothetical protein [Caulobacter sp. DWP3-1-3b2]|uniref:hypothetical protein n=1 Tax=Caulobacter sp. DWP3-1-3b2 TaxID=2804643 RepID=UPI003CF12AA3